MLLFLPGQALAQRKLWGATVTFAPIWQTVEFSKYLNGAEELNLKGTSFKVGVSRGTPLGGDWSLLYVHRQLKSGGVVDQGEGRFTTNDDVVLQGFEAEKFAVKKSINDHVLLGVVIAAGVAVVQGTMTAENGSIVNAKDVLTLWGTDIRIQPLFRIEFGAGFVVARGFRIRASGGFDWPGFSASIGATYFFGDR